MEQVDDDDEEEQEELRRGFKASREAYTAKQAYLDKLQGGAGSFQPTDQKS